MHRLIAAVVATVVTLTLGTACTSHEADNSTHSPASVGLRYQPQSGATDVSPITPVSVSAAGALREVKLTNSSGKQVKGALSPDSKTFTTAEPLGYGVTYTWSGTASGADKHEVPLSGSFTTLTPKSKTSANVQIGDGQVVGIAAPIVLQFDAHVVDKAAVERALTVSTTPPPGTPPTVGGWAWFPDDNGGSRVHWRPQQYWTPGTKVHLDAKLYGVNFGAGAFGASDLTSDFTIGRSQIVKANAPSHRMQVVRDGKVVMDFAVSYGQGDQARNVTRSGIHVVTEKHEDFAMSNPPFYTNVRERWAVRISNNGEFIHANPLTVGVQGSANVSNGCINLSPNNAQEFFPTALYGDPVEVTGTSIQLSAADGDLYDWTIGWPAWQSMSALHGQPAPVVSAAPVPPQPAPGH